MKPAPLLEIEALAVGYHRRAVASGLNARLDRGTLCALLAANGTGKSTLLRTLCGLQPALGGTIRIDGRCLEDSPPTALARTVAVVLARPRAGGALTVGEVVALGRLPHTGPFRRPSDADRTAVSQALEAVGIAHLADRRVGTLSDGERQKAFIAKALAQEAPVLLLDEPTAFLDYPSKIALFRLLAHLAHDGCRAILVSTHDVETALHLSDRLWLLRPDGITCGTPRALAADGCIARFFRADGLRFTPSALRFEAD